MVSYHMFINGCKNETLDTLDEIGRGWQVPRGRHWHNSSIQPKQNKMNVGVPPQLYPLKLYRKQRARPRAQIKDSDAKWVLIYCPQEICLVFPELKNHFTKCLSQFVKEYSLAQEISRVFSSWVRNYSARLSPIPSYPVHPNQSSSRPRCSVSTILPWCCGLRVMSKQNLFTIDEGSTIFISFMLAASHEVPWTTRNVGVWFL